MRNVVVLDRLKMIPDVSIKVIVLIVLNVPKNLQFFFNLTSAASQNQKTKN